MPFLTIGSVTVEVHVDGGIQERHTEIGDKGRAFDGSFRSTVRSTYKQEWSGIRTVVLSQTDANALLAELKHATQPRACSGDLTGSVNCFPTNIQVTPVGLGATHSEVVTFDLMEA